MVTRPFILTPIGSEVVSLGVVQRLCVPSPSFFLLSQLSFEFSPHPSFLADNSQTTRLYLSRPFQIASLEQAYQRLYRGVRHFHPGRFTSPLPFSTLRVYMQHVAAQSAMNM